MIIPNKKTIERMAGGIRHVCENFINRTAGSASERRCQEYFKKQVGRYADASELEDFSLRPNAFLGWIKIAAPLSCLSVLFYWLSRQSESLWMPLASAVLIMLSVLMYILEFVLCRRFVDFLFRKVSSVNLMARRHAKGEVKRRIIFGGHADAAYEWRYSMHGKIKALLPVMAGSSLAMLFVFAANTILFIDRLTGGTVAAGQGLAVGIAELFCIPFFIAVFFFINWRMTTCGANDNLSGCYVSMAVLKELHDHDIRFENTEVCCLITGAEEAGLRGGLAYARRHREELAQIPTVFIALDTLRECRQLLIYHRGQTGTQKNSSEAAQLIEDAARQCGIELRRAGFYPGATDAEAFSRHGIKAVALCGADHNPQTYYHTRKDTWYNVDQECLKMALEICLEAVLQFDKSGLPAPG